MVIKYQIFKVNKLVKFYEVIEKERSIGNFLNIERPYVAKNGKTYRKQCRAGCGKQCQNQLGLQDLDCPSCGKFTWHKKCLLKAFAHCNIPVPDLTTSDWKCPQCAWVFASDSEYTLMFTHVFMNSFMEVS